MDVVPPLVYFYTVYGCGDINSLSVESSPSVRIGDKLPWPHRQQGSTHFQYVLFTEARCIVIYARSTFRVPNSVPSYSCK